MQTLFENRYTLTEPLVKELYRRIKLRSTYALLLYASCIYFLARTIWVLFFGGEMLPIFPIIAAYALIRHFMGYRRAVRQTMGPKTAKPAQQHLSITEKGIFIDGDANGIPFSKFDKVYRTKNLIILVTKNKMAVMLPKDSFTKGELADFLLLLILNGFKIR